MVSIVIPVYNVEEYIKPCLDSVIKQSYRELEIIIVDDGSKDMSGSICDEYVGKDSRIKVFHKKNGGLSDARNFGVQEASGSYVFYLDSDDYLETNAIERLVTIAQKEECDVVTSNFFYSYQDHEDFAFKVVGDYCVLKKNDAMKELVKGSIIQNFAWGKLIKTNIAKRNLFPYGKLFEDFFWTHYIIDQSEKIAVDFKPSVHYRQRDNSISYQFKLSNLDQLDGMLERKKFLDEKYPEIVNTYDKQMAKTALTLCWYTTRYLKGQEKNKAIKRLRDFFNITNIAYSKDIIESQKTQIEAFQKNIFKYMLIVVRNKGRAIDE